VGNIVGREHRLDFRSLRIMMRGREWLTSDWLGGRERAGDSGDIPAGLSMLGIADDVRLLMQRAGESREEKKSVSERHCSRQNNEGESRRSGLPAKAPGIES
jgi:hypothetical protein